MKALEWLKVRPGKPARETASGSVNPQVSRAGVARESAAATSPGPIRVMGHLREAAAAPAGAAPGVGSEAPGRRFRVVLIQEGMGNLEDCYYYTREAIESCPPLFEGKKLFVDHPDAQEEQIRPERSVRDVAGYFENVAVENAQDGRAQLCGDAVLLESPDVESIRALMLESIAYSKTHSGADLVGLSISAGGDFETVSLEQFVRAEEIPESCKPKLGEAAAKGISMIRPVRRMTSATSCDLVTEAGAGGRISQLLEREKSKMAAKVAATKVKESEGKKEAENKEAGAKEDGGAPAKDGSADGKGGGSKDHPDAEQDKELIKKMMQKHCGDGFTDEDNAMATEAYQNALEAHEGDEKEAMETAGRVMKMARHAKQKQAKQAQAEAEKQQQAKEAEGPTAEGNKEAGSDAGQQTRGMVPGPSSASNGAAPGPNTKVESAETKESAEVLAGKLKESEAKVLTLTAEVAGLKSKIEERELNDFIDKSLRESRLPNTATKKFRECIKGIKTQKEVTEKLELFREAYSHGTGEAGDGSGLFVLPEKQASGGAEGSISFADCVDA